MPVSRKWLEEKQLSAHDRDSSETTPWKGVSTRSTTRNKEWIQLWTVFSKELASEMMFSVIQTFDNILTDQRQL